METRIIVTYHAQTRISERGGNVVTVISAVRQASSRILSAGIRSGNRRVALKAPNISTVPIVEICPRKYGFGLVIVTVLPCSTKTIPHHPVVVVENTRLHANAGMLS